jgi:hypothetical protein
LKGGSGDSGPPFFHARQAELERLCRQRCEEVGLVSGIAYDGNGDAQASMGVDCGDYDNDGRLDFHLTSYAKEFAGLCNNVGDGLFEDVTLASGAGAGTLPHMTWGNGLIDFDSAGNHWLQIRLRGVKTNRDGVGARVRVTSSDLTQVAEVHSGRGYQRHYGTQLHFGLGNRQRVDRIEVRWLGGTVDRFANLPADRFLTITEGDPKVRATLRPAARGWQAAGRRRPGP